MNAEQQRGVLGEQSAGAENKNDPIRIGVCLPVAPGGARRVERLICDRRLYDGDPRISRWWRDVPWMRALPAAYERRGQWRRLIFGWRGWIVRRTA